MTFFFILLVIVALAAVSLVAAGRIGRGSDAVRDRAPSELPHAPVTAQSLRAARLTVGFRGYRMDEVDALLAQVEETLRLHEEPELVQTAQSEVVQEEQQQA